MKVYEKSHKLDHVCYDIRGPIMEEANRMIAGGEDVLKLNIGNPAYFGFRTPEVLLDYMADKLPDTEGYSDSHGLVSAREAICEYCREKGIPNVGINDVFTGNGVSELITLSMQGLLDNGDEVLVPTPDYPLWTASVTLAGGKAVHYICDEQSNWYPDIEDMRRKVTDKTKGIVVINPNNPTGAVATREQLQAWVDYAESRGAVILFDSAYEAFISDPSIPHSIFEIEGARRCAIEFRSFSKTAGFTGNRCAYTVVPRDLERGGASLNTLWNRRQTTKFNGVPYVVQRGAQAVYSDAGRAQVRETIAFYQNNARVIQAGLAGAGLTVSGGENSPYVWAKTPHGMGSWAFFDLLLQQAGVVTTPGAGFGPSGEGYIRLSAFGGAEDTAEAVERIRAVL